jgi:hypothetical protein
MFQSLDPNSKIRNWAQTIIPREVLTNHPHPPHPTPFFSLSPTDTKKKKEHNFQKIDLANDNCGGEFEPATQIWSWEKERKRSGGCVLHAARGSRQPRLDLCPVLQQPINLSRIYFFCSGRKTPIFLGTLTSIDYKFSSPNIYRNSRSVEKEAAAGQFCEEISAHSQEREERFVRSTLPWQDGLREGRQVRRVKPRAMNLGLTYDRYRVSS